MALRALREFCLLGVVGLLGGCAGPQDVELPAAPSFDAQEMARDQQTQTSARVRFDGNGDETSCVTGRARGRGSTGFRVHVGRSVCEALAALTRDAIDSDGRGDAVVIRVSELQADCSLDGPRAVAVVGVELETSGLDAPLRIRLRGTGVDEGERVWTLSGPERLQEAFALAREDLERSYVRYLRDLELPARLAREVVRAPDPELPARLAREVVRAPEDASHDDGANADSREAEWDWARRAPPAPAVSAPARSVPSVAISEPLTEVPAGVAEELEQIDGYLTLGDLQSAHDAVSALIRRAPNAAPAYQRRAAIRLMLRDLDAAMADCFRALELAPKSALAYVTRASVYLERGEVERARQDCETAERFAKGGAAEAAVRRLLERLDGRR